jgi:hypothetical protein
MLVWLQETASTDVDLMPEHYLEPRVESSEPLEGLAQRLHQCVELKQVLDLLVRADFGPRNIHLFERFRIGLGRQFSESDAYQSPGMVPVFTASIVAPEYYVQSNLNGKSMVCGPAILWGRKGNAGMTHCVTLGKSFYITDVSGIIRPKPSYASRYFLPFMSFYLSGLFRQRVQAAENLAQINKTTIANQAFAEIPLVTQIELFKAIPKTLLVDSLNWKQL